MTFRDKHSEGLLPFLPTISGHCAADDAVALFDDSSDEWLSYGKLREKINKQQPLFEKTQHRDLVFCCIPRSIDGVVAYLAAVASGHAIALINPTLSHLDKLVEAYAPAFIVLPAEMESVAGYEFVTGFCKSLTLLRKVDQVVKKINPNFFLLLLTSGSTGSNKGVRLSYRNLSLNTAAIIKSIDLKAEDRSLGHLPLSYSFGISVLHTTLAVGGSCLLSEHSMMTSKLWALAAKEKVSLFPGVPYHYEMLMRLGMERIQVPCLKTFLQAGGKMDVDESKIVLEKVLARQGRLFVMYGQTEASPRISCYPLHDHPEKIGSAGKALDGGKLDVLSGEIVYSGPNVMLGYAEGAGDLGKGDVMNGRLVTGDLGLVDEDGYLFLTGRKQRFAKLFGQRISLDDLERLAGERARTFAVEGKNKIFLFVFRADQVLIKEMKRTLSLEAKMPQTWFDVLPLEEVPYQQNGKVDYKKLRLLALS